MRHIACYLSLVCVVALLIFAPASTAQQLGSMGELDRSIGGLDRGVNADAGGQAHPGASGGKGALNSTSSSTWSTKPVVGTSATQGDASAKLVGSWSPERQGKQNAKSRPGAGMAPSNVPVISNEPMLSSLGNKAGTASSEKAKKDRGVKPLLPPGGMTGPDLPPEPFAFKGFGGSGHYAYSGSPEARKKSREKLAKKFKGRPSPGMVSKKRKVTSKPAMDVQAHDDQGCADASKLRLCTWLSPK